MAFAETELRLRRPASSATLLISTVANICMIFSCCHCLIGLPRRVKVHAGFGVCFFRQVCEASMPAGAPLRRVPLNLPLRGPWTMTGAIGCMTLSRACPSAQCDRVLRMRSYGSTLVTGEANTHEIACGLHGRSALKLEAKRRSTARTPSLTIATRRLESERSPISPHTTK